MAYPDFTNDLYEDFEDALGSGWTVVDPDNNLDITAAATLGEYGTKGLEHLYAGSTAGNDIAYAYYTFSSSKTQLSIVVKFKFSTLTNTWYTNNILDIDLDVAAFSLCRIQYYWDGTNYNVWILGKDGVSSSLITFSSPGPYALCVQTTKNGTTYLSIYDLDTKTQVGSEVSVVAPNYDINYILLGSILVTSSTGYPAVTYYDDLVGDYTDATYPLLGWESGAPAGISMPLIMLQHNQFAGGKCA